ncbi:MAG: HEPN domain-containing protein [Prevotella sp.]|nr:HEPN domain-containing protein [Prevotella sp.]
MSLNDEERRIMVRHEMEKANNTFAQVEVLANSGFWDGAANRLYYSAFHAVCALLIHDGHSVRTHNGASALFREKYVKTGILSTESSQLYSILQTMREKSDYNCSFNATQDIISPMIEPTRKLIEAIEKLTQE